ncbi:MAG: hypothetical protein MR372_06665 [Lachnospiraceae bacterium]|nr:hypothetical protein [Lachnospiraceae bacterium]MDY6222092.1 hypothetical protein [Candidatus Alectryocaccobium sp.]
MKTIKVVAAIIRDKDKIFATERGYGEYKGWWEFPDFHLSMDCFWCEVISGDLVLKEHEASGWLTYDSLYDVKWLPTDKSLIPKIQIKLQEAQHGC